MSAPMRSPRRGAESPRRRGAESPRRRSPMHSARSSCSSLSQKRARRRPLAMTALPSVQQLAAVGTIIDKAASTGFKPNLALEHDLIAALERRVGSKEASGAGHDPSVARKRRASFDGSYGTPFGSKESTGHHKIYSARNIHAHGSPKGSPRSMNFRTAHTDQSSSSHSHGRRDRKAATDVPGGHAAHGGHAAQHHLPGLPLSSESSYRLIPTESMEEEEAEEDTEEVKQKDSRTRTRKKEKNSRVEALAQMPEWRISGQDALQGLCFQTVMALLIMGNSLVIGLETDIKYEYWDKIENTFLFCFCGELVLKLLFHGCDLYHRENPDFNWNCFDTFIVSLGVLDFIAGLLTTQKGGSLATLFRIIRLLRILRIIRIVKFLKQLYLLALGLAEAAQAVFWVTILMTFILYVTSIVMVKTIGRPPDSDPNQEFLFRHFGGVLPSMLSLFVLMSSPNLPVYQDQLGLLEERPLFALFLVVFIVFGSFGMVALLTGVISESMFEKNNMRKEEERIEHEKLRMDVGVRCEELFDTFEKDDEDEVNIEDLKEEDAVIDMARTFEAAGVFVTTYDLCTMVDYLDIDGSGTINKEEFMRGMLVLAEGLRPISVQEVHHDVGVCRVKLERIETTIEELMKKLNSDGSNETGRALSGGNAEKDPPPRVATSTISSHAEFGTNSSSHKMMEHLSDQIQDLAHGQKQMCKNSRDLDGRMREISHQIQTLLGEDIAALKTHLSTRIQEMGQQIVRECCKKEQASRDSTWPSMSFSAAGSSAEQVGGGASSAAAGAEQKFFTFELDQLMSPTRHHTQETRSQSEVADTVIEAVRQPSTATASTAGATAASTSAMAMLASPPQARPSHVPEASTSRGSTTSAHIWDARGSIAAARIQELTSLQQRIQTELQNVSHQEAMTGMPQATRPASTFPSTQSAQAAAAAQAAHTAQAPYLPQFSSAVQPMQVPEAAQAARAAQVLQALQSQAQVPSSSAASVAVGEPVRHPSELGNTASLAELLNQVRELVSNHETLRRSSVSASADVLTGSRSSVTASADVLTSRSNEVLEYEES